MAKKKVNITAKSRLEFIQSPESFFRILSSHIARRRPNIWPAFVVTCACIQSRPYDFADVSERLVQRNPCFVSYPRAVNSFTCEDMPNGRMQTHNPKFRSLFSTCAILHFKCERLTRTRMAVDRSRSRDSKVASVYDASVYLGGRYQRARRSILIRRI